MKLRTALEFLIFVTFVGAQGCQDAPIPAGPESSTTGEGSQGDGTAASSPDETTETATSPGHTSQTPTTGDAVTTSTTGDAVTTSTTDDAATTSTTDDAATTSTTDDAVTTSTTDDAVTTSTTDDAVTTSTTDDAVTTAGGSTGDTGDPADCGDGQALGAEACDDGNVIDGDGCSAACEVEPGYGCEGQPSVCTPWCGDGIVAGSEGCDDGNLGLGDGCDLECEVGFGWACAGSPSTCEVTASLDALALGFTGGCLLTTTGEVGCFASNLSGQAGNGSFTPAHLPVFTTDDALSLTFGQTYACAVRAGDTAWCWGSNQRRQLGPQSAVGVAEPLPVEVADLPLVSAIEAGWHHTCAIDLGGQVWCWGGNDAHQLGRGGFDVADHSDPAAIAMPGGLGAVAVSGGDHHGCAILADATVACWGYDAYGQLGDGAAGANGTTPALVPGLALVEEVSCGRESTCSRTTTGQVYCWGRNNEGQLGIGSLVSQATPQLVNLPAAADAVAAGNWFTCALLANDEVYCWGLNGNHQLGSGNVVRLTTPTLVMNVPALDFIDIEVGSTGGCLLSSMGERHCWGTSIDGRLGITPLDQLEPEPVVFSGPLDELVLSVYAENVYGVICGVLQDGTVECAGSAQSFGIGGSGARGLLAPQTHPEPTPIPVSVIDDVEDFAIGGFFACAATSTDVLCWGLNTENALGQANGVTVLLAPTPVPNLGGPVDEIDAGLLFACARTGGTVECWGSDTWRQTGMDNDPEPTMPNLVPALVDAVQVELGGEHACALRATGAVVCWGRDNMGQLGDADGNPLASSIPQDVTGLPAAPVTQLAVGAGHACALAGGEVYCWGSGAEGVLGQGNTVDSDTALLVPGLVGITQISAGHQRSCALDGAGTAWCWGNGTHGELGDGGPLVTGSNQQLAPAPFALASGVTQVVAGRSSTCIETAAGWSCVGLYSAGQLGSGVTQVEPFPAPLAFGP